MSALSTTPAPRRDPAAGAVAATGTAGWSWPSSSSPTSWTCSTPPSPTSPAPRSGPTSAAAASTLQWVLAAYTMSFAIGLIVSARLGDLVGRRRMFIIGMVGFTRRLAAVRARADRRAADRGFRVLQGVFGAAMIPQGLAMVKQSFAPRRPAEGVHPVRPDHGAGRRARPDPGRRPARRRPVRHRLADDLPDQRPGRPGRRRPRVALPARPPARPRGHGSTPWGALLLTAASALLIYPLVQGRELGWPLVVLR